MEGAGDASWNGYYFKNGVYNERDKYQKIGRTDRNIDWRTSGLWSMNSGGEPYRPAYKVECPPTAHPPETGWIVHDHGAAPPPRVLWLADNPQQAAAAGGGGAKGAAYELQMNGRYVAGVTGSGSSQQVLTGRVELGDDEVAKVTWVARQGETVQSRFEGLVLGSQPPFTLTGTLFASDAQVPVTGTLKQPGIRVLKVGKALHPSLHGISLTRRRVRLLQSMAACFRKVGPLSSSDTQVRLSSDRLSVGALELLTSDPSEEVQNWSARMLVTRLDNGGALCLASTGVLMTKLLAQSFRGAESPCKMAQSTLVAALLSKLAASPNCDANILADLIDALHTELTKADPTGQVIQCLQGLYNSCHNPTVRSALREAKWSALFWSLVESSAYPTSTRNMVLELLSWTLSPTSSSLTKLLTLITTSSPERSCWGHADTPAPAIAGMDTVIVKQVDPARGRYTCTCSPEVSIGIRARPTEEHGPGSTGVRRGGSIDVATIVSTTQADMKIDYLQLVSGGFCPLRLPALRDGIYFERVGDIPDDDGGGSSVSAMPAGMTKMEQMKVRH